MLLRPALSSPLDPRRHRHQHPGAGDAEAGKDDKFLEVAVAGQADVIVTGDEDLKTSIPSREFP